MPPLPTGTVTFLFTDIEGSTKLWEEHPEAMRVALARHDALLRAAIENNNGVVFKTIGDAFCAAFAAAPDALNAALQAQMQLNHGGHGEEMQSDPQITQITQMKEQGSGTLLMPHPVKPENPVNPVYLPSPPSVFSVSSVVQIRVRMALHAGMAELRDNDYFGQPLNRVARLLAIGHGGQTLLSQTVHELGSARLPAGCRLVDRGEQRLKDLQQPEHVWQLCHPDLPEEFPPLKSLNTRLHNLPVQTTSFIGRDREMADIKALLSVTRLLTLAGSGGTGKTRLSLQVAADLTDDYADGVWLIELAPLSDPALVPQAIASTLGIREEPGRALAQTLTDALMPKQMLLLLDNCEHVLDVASKMADTLLRNCPGVQILASSREGLGISGEQTYRVPPLGLPRLAGRVENTGAEALLGCESVRLFSARAALVKTDFAVTDANAPALAQLCHRLDGIPLALELAAARVRVMPVEQIETRLHDRFRLLTGGSRTALPRQQTLRALIDWSYDLLTGPEKTLLLRLSVFAGGWTLEAAEQVCADAEENEAKEGDAEILFPYDVLDLLTALVDKSLVLYNEGEETSRYRLLETIRQYAQDRLFESQDAPHARERHRDYYLAFAEATALQVNGPTQETALGKFQAERDNLRAALSWSLDAGEREAGLRLALAVNPFWMKSIYFGEAVEWFDRFLSAFDSHSPDTLTVKALNAAAISAWRLGDYPGSRTYVDKSIPMARALGEETGLRQALNTLANTLYYQGDFAAACPLYAEFLELARKAGVEREISTGLNNLGLAESDAGNREAAQRCFEEALDLRRKMGDQAGIANVLNNLGELALARGEIAEADALLLEAYAIRRDSADKLALSYTLHSLAGLRIRQGEWNQARRFSIESLLIKQETGEKWGIAVLLETIAELLLRTGSPARACRLLGAADALRTALGSAMPPTQRAEYDVLVAAVREALSETDFNEQWSGGSQLTPEQAITFAVEDVTLPPKIQTPMI